MGCSSSLAMETVLFTPTKIGGIARYQIPLDQGKKDAIRKSWKLVEPVKSSAGRTMFIRLFTDYPSAQSKFPSFQNVPLDELVRSRAFYLHSRRVMDSVENAVSALDDAEVFITYLRELGRRHAPCLMKKNLFAVVGEALMSTFRDMLSVHFTTQVEQAWTELFVFIADTMVEGASNNAP